MVKLGLDLSRISSGDLTAPLKLKFWAVQKSPRMRHRGVSRTFLADLKMPASWELGTFKGRQTCAIDT